MFELENAIRRWKRGLAENESLEDGAIAEIEAHLRDGIEDFIERGSSPEQAFERAVTALGRKGEIGREFFKAKEAGRSARLRGRWPGFRLSLGRNYFTIALRKMYKHKAFSAINIAGLALGMACCLLIAFWVRDERSYDQFHRNGRRIYRIVCDWEKYKWEGMDTMPPTLGPAAKDGLPEIENAARLIPTNRRVFHYRDKAFYEDRGLVVDPSFFEIFTFPFLKGDPRTALSGPADVVVTETTAAKYFGAGDPIGQTIDAEGQALVVRGVLKDIPRHSTLQFDYVQRLDTHFGSNAWGAFTTTTFLLLRADANPRAMGAKLTGIGRNSNSPQIKAGASFRLQPLNGVHLDARTFQRATMDLGNAKSVSLFSAIAVFILIIACINFVNLSVARSAQRAREVGLRKTIGAGRGDLMRQFFGESFLLVLTAAAFSLVLVRLCLPVFNRLAGKSLDPNLFRFEYLAGTILVALATGILAGSYPALLLSAFRPVQALKGKVSSSVRGGSLRKILVVFQFSLSIFLFISALALLGQFRYMRNAELGYDKDNVVQLSIKENVGKSFAAMKEQLLKSPAVLAVTAEGYPFAEYGSHSSGNWDWEGRDPNKSIDMIYRGVTDDFVEAMGMTMAAGRSFPKDISSNASRNVILNEEAVRAMGLENPVGKWFSTRPGEKLTIIGVVKDVHFETLHQKVGPEFYYLADLSRAVDRGLILVRIRGDRTRDALAHIRRVWQNINPIAPFEFRFLDETYARLYRAEDQRSRVFLIFTGVAIFVACLGLLGLTLFVAERRRKEIGIRKVIGASAAEILIMISSQLTKWVLAANILAWPAAFLAINQLLQGYPYRIRLGLGLFVVPALTVFALACLTVAWQSARSARTNPAEILRHE